MRDVVVTTFIFILLFIVLTTDATQPMGGFSVDTWQGLHRLTSEIIFWAGTLYLCASGTYGALMRQDRFALSQKHPMLNRLLSWVLLASPFLAVFIDARFVLVMLGLLMVSHLRSRNDDEKTVQLMQSRSLSNMLLIPIFTLSLMLMSINGYKIGSIFDIGVAGSGDVTINDVRQSTQGSQEVRDAQ